jgi:hypothetical protein
MGRGVDHPPPSSAKVEERVELYLYSRYGSSWPVVGVNFTLLYFILVTGVYSVVVADRTVFHSATD